MDSSSQIARDRLRFGIFMPTVSNSPNISHYKADQSDWTFATNRAIAQAAEAAGFDFLFPVSRWRTIGGDIDYHGKSLETMTWASALFLDLTHSDFLDRACAGFQSGSGGEDGGESRSHRCGPLGHQYRERLESR